MSDFNKVVVTGRLTRDVEMRQTKSGATLGSTAIAIDTSYGDRDCVCFLDLTLWGKTAETCQRVIGKGSRVVVEGRLQQDTWDDAGGNKRSKITCSVVGVTFLDKKPVEDTDGTEEGEVPF